VRRYGVAEADVGIRGYNQPYNPRLLVLVNGRQVYSDDFGHTAWPTIARAVGRVSPDRGRRRAELSALWLQCGERRAQHYHLRPTARARQRRRAAERDAALCRRVRGEHRSVRRKRRCADLPWGLSGTGFCTPRAAPADSDIRQSPTIETFNIDGRLSIRPSPARTRFALGSPRILRWVC
jgi:hypothetical protein